MRSVWNDVDFPLGGRWFENNLYTQNPRHSIELQKPVKNVDKSALFLLISRFLWLQGEKHDLLYYSAQKRFGRGLNV